MKIILPIWKLTLVFLLLLSLTLNVAMFVGGTIYKMASSAFSAATGVRTVAVQHAGEVAELGSDLTNQRRVSRELRGEVAELSGDLATERLALKTARGQLTDAGADMVTYRGKRMARKQAVAATADSISKRAVITSGRSITSMAGEALPYIGTAVIVGVTALELKDLCDTIKDMNELRRMFNPELEPSEDQATVCSMKVPTTGELWEIAMASPELAWAAAKEATPTLEEIQNYEFPDIDWAGAWNSTAEGAGNVWSATKSGAGAAVDATAETTGGWINSATKYWSDDDGQMVDE